jgi:hypothetical protein
MADGGPQQQQQRKQRKRQQHQKQPVRRRKEEECVGALEGDEDGGAAECGGDGAGAGGDGGVARARKRSRRGGANSSGSGRGAGAGEDEAGAGARKPVALLGARELGPDVPLELTFPCGRTFKVRRPAPLHPRAPARTRARARASCFRLYCGAAGAPCHAATTIAATSARPLPPPTLSTPPTAWPRCRGPSISSCGPTNETGCALG